MTKRGDSMAIRVTYLHHSGFAVELAHDYLVFDWDGTRPAPRAPRDPPEETA